MNVFGQSRQNIDSKTHKKDLIIISPIFLIIFIKGK